MEVNPDTASQVGAASQRAGRQADPAKGWSAALERAWVSEWPTGPLPPSSQPGRPALRATAHQAESSTTHEAASALPSAWIAQGGMPAAAAHAAQPVETLPSKAALTPQGLASKAADRPQAQAVLAQATAPVHQQPEWRAVPSQAQAVRAAPRYAAHAVAGELYGASWMSLAQPTPDFAQVNVRYRELSADREASVARTLADTLSRDGISQTRIYVNGHLYLPKPDPTGD